MIVLRPHQDLNPGLRGTKSANVPTRSIKVKTILYFQSWLNSCPASAPTYPDAHLQPSNDDRQLEQQFNQHRQQPRKRRSIRLLSNSTADKRQRRNVYSCRRRQNSPAYSARIFSSFLLVGLQRERSAVHLQKSF